ncbi:DUF6870 family protein [Lysinibacillus sp. FSL H8-0500]|uniref:DUF6870 domain-containing protein n=1 Tax=Lysinibacillus macroides TaxID=33935 RepID=A0A0M9DHP1_9BACI|nr:hypothetical protein [Lysinibacillus macroides]KOY80646.1 hypothetical protein ADM90_15715 [Lysinibacillus macroides]QPR69782.1 hypothetical protein I6G82_09470 [Lysinibacillus macroides]
MGALKGLAEAKHKAKETRPTQDLIDIRHIQIQHDLPALERLEKYLQDIQKPYQFLCGNVTVYIRFLEDGNDLSMQLKRYFSSYNH